MPSALYWLSNDIDIWPTVGSYCTQDIPVFRGCQHFMVNLSDFLLRAGMFPSIGHLLCKYVNRLCLQIFVNVFTCLFC